MALCPSVIGGMISKPPKRAVEACASHIDENLGDPESYPGLVEAAEALLRVVAERVLGEPSPGWFTSGATESNILALYYWRERGRRRVLYFETAHYSVGKAASLLGLDSRSIPLTEEGLRVLRDTAGPRDVIVVTIGTTQEGWIEPLGDVVEIARRTGATIHVDAAFVGYIVRHLPRQLKLALEPPVSTLAVDLHKIPEAPMPLGVLLASDEEVISSLYHGAPYIPSGRQFGLLGSRPACPVYAAIESIRYLDEEFGGVQGLASELMALKQRIAAELESAGYVPVESPTPIVCLRHNSVSRIVAQARRAGIHLYTCPRHGGVRIAVMPHHIYIPGEAECIIDTLSSLAAPRRHRDRGATSRE